MKKIITYIFVIGLFSNAPSYALKNYDNKIFREKGKYGFSLISEEVVENDNNKKFDKNNWIRTRQRKIQCGQPNIVGIQSTSSALIIASIPKPIPDYTKCNKIIRG